MPAPQLHGHGGLFPSAYTRTFNSLPQSMPRLFPMLNVPIQSTNFYPYQASRFGSPLSSGTMPSLPTMSVRVTPTIASTMPLQIPTIRGPLSELSQNIMDSNFKNEKSVSLSSPLRASKQQLGLDPFDSVQFDSSANLSTPKARQKHTPLPRPLSTRIGRLSESPKDLVGSVKKVKGEFVQVRVAEIEDTIRRQSTTSRISIAHKSQLSS